jgi:predicted phosphodiesterase
MMRTPALPTVQAHRIAVLGDVHLAAPGRPLSFRGQADDLAALVDRLADDHDIVIINGDLYDLDRGPLPFTYRRELQLARAASPELTRRLGSSRVRLTAGNHDATLARTGDAVDGIDLVAGASVRVRVEHGHRFDAWIKRWRPFTSAVTWMSGRAVQVGADPIYRTMRRIERHLTGEAQPVDPRQNPIHQRAFQWLQARGEYDALIVGHSHRAGLWCEGGRLLANPGACADGRLSWVSIDLDAGRAAIYAIENGTVFGLGSTAQRAPSGWTLDAPND